MKNLILTTALVIAASSCGVFGLRCNHCDDIFDKTCKNNDPRECDPKAHDYCVDILYPETRGLYKECMSKKELKTCLNGIDGILCIACDKDLCNDITAKEFEGQLHQCNVDIQKERGHLHD